MGTIHDGWRTFGHTQTTPLISNGFANSSPSMRQDREHDKDQTVVTKKLQVPWRCDPSCNRYHLKPCLLSELGPPALISYTGLHIRTLIDPNVCFR